MILELIRNDDTIQIFGDMKFNILDTLDSNKKHIYELQVSDEVNGERIVYQLETIPTYNVGGTIVTCREKQK